MYIEIIIIIAGLIGLWYGSDLLLTSGKNIARHFGISDFFFGLAFVSIGTSIPEIAVSIAGAIDRLNGIETSGIVLGDKIGSAIVNITLFMGIFGLFIILRLKKKELITQSMSLIGSTVFFFLLAFDGVLSRGDGVLFLIAFGLYYAYLYKTEPVRTTERKPKLEVAKDIIFAIAGVLFIIVSSNAVVMHGVKLAEALGVNQTLIGIFLVGIGTGLPELSVMLASARHRMMSLSMGDLIGSNIVDLLLATGLGGLISSFIVDKRLLAFDIPALFIFSVILIYYLRKDSKITRVEGISLIILYLVYAIMAIRLNGNV
ncbi:sodium:calcium antiporter [Candidatus Woesearchaeota archaeon]|nr:sodium:calcium antiporter [Candidatus Woesearchaeota archaeon]